VFIAEDALDDPANHLF